MVMSFRESRPNGSERQPLTAKLGEVAHYSGKMPRTVEEYRTGVARDAWLLYKSMLRHARGMQVWDGVSGWVFTGSARRLLAVLHPSVPPAKLAEYSRDVYAFLRQTHNAVCVQRPTGPASGGSPAVWWVRKEWNDEASTAVVLSRYVQSWTEGKLSPTEAGEDREPAPVETRKVEPAEPSSSDSQESETGSSMKLDPRWRAEFLRVRRRAPDGALERTARVMAQQRTPVTSIKVYEKSGLLNLTQVHVPLRTLEDMGLVSAREPAGLHDGVLWSTSSAQRAMLAELLAVPWEQINTARDSVDTRAVVWPVLVELTESEGAARVAAVTRRTFLGRHRVLAVLKALTVEGWLVRERDRSVAREATWRVVTGVASPPPEPDSVPPPEEEPPIPEDAEQTAPEVETSNEPAQAEPIHEESATTSDEDVSAIAGFVAELVDRKLAARGAVDRAEVDALTAERDDLASRLSEVTGERNRLQDELDELRSTLQRLIGPRE